LCAGGGGAEPALGVGTVGERGRENSFVCSSNLGHRCLKKKGKENKLEGVLLVHKNLSIAEGTNATKKCTFKHFDFISPVCQKRCGSLKKKKKTVTEKSQSKICF